MKSSSARPGLAVSVTCDRDAIIVRLDDGREVRAPLTERLRAATPEQRAAGRVDDFGTGLRWDEIDEDLSVAPLLGVTEDALFDLAGFARDPR